MENTIEYSINESSKIAQILKYSISQNMIKKSYSETISDEVYNELKMNIYILKLTEDFNKYLEALKRICHLCHMPSKNLIITKYRLEKKKYGKNKIYIEYSNNAKKIKIDEDTKLYHFSNIPDLKRLKPSFRGKPGKNYLYSSKRIYLTMFNKIPKFVMDYKAKDTLYKYKVSCKVSDVFIDPLIWFMATGAVYIETDKYIPVKHVDKDDKNNFEEEYYGQRS